MNKTVTFETQCYENDYEHVLNVNRLKASILNCNYDFDKRVVIINKVFNRKKAAQLADACVDAGIVDDYYFAADYSKKALDHFHFKPKDFKGGYYYSRGQLVGLYLCDTDYLVHFTGDSYIAEKNSSSWIKDGMTVMEKDPKYLCATPLWYHSLEGAKAEASEEFGDWYAGYGFSDNCYLVKTATFKQDIYHEYNPASDRYPTYAGECFEKRVDSFMRNHGFLRLINKTTSYVHTDFPKKRSLKTIGTLQKPFKKARNAALSVSNRVRHRFQNPMQAHTAIIQEIPGMTKYRTSIKIYDIFTFFNELELLEMRLNILDKYVDYFVIVECTETFSGKPKPLVFEEHKDRFKKYQDKIIHYVTTDSPKSEHDLRERLRKERLSELDQDIIIGALTSDNVPKGQLHWMKEFYQKESIKKALVSLEDNDICFVGDMDEIWNPGLVIDYRSDDIFKLRQDVYSYYLNNRSSEPWAGTLVTKYKNIKNSYLNHLRTTSKTPYTYIKNGGWHFTNQGGADRIRKKLESYGHQEFNNDEVKRDLENKMQQNRDFIGRKFKFWVDESGLPDYIKQHKTKYKHFFK